MKDIRFLVSECWGHGYLQERRRLSIAFLERMATHGLEINHRHNTVLWFIQALWTHPFVTGIKSVTSNRRLSPHLYLQTKGCQIGAEAFKFNMTPWILLHPAASSEKVGSAPKKGIYHHWQASYRIDLPRTVVFHQGWGVRVCDLSTRYRHGILGSDLYQAMAFAAGSFKSVAIHASHGL
jgi:hypothetical protein